MQKVINYLINQCEINKNKKSNNNSTILDCTDYNIIQIIIKENH